MLDYKELSINPYHLNKNISVANAPGPFDKTYGNIFEYGADQLDTWTTNITPHPDSPAGKRLEEYNIKEQMEKEKEERTKEIMSNSVLGDEDMRVIPITNEEGEIIDHQQAPMPEDSIKVINKIPEIEEENRGSIWDFDN